MATDPVQTEVAAAILRVTATHDFALAGAYGLNVRGVVDRPTEDVDLFTTRARGPADVLPAVTAALTDAGYTVQVTRPPTADGDFATPDDRRRDRPRPHHRRPPRQQSRRPRVPVRDT